MNRRIFFRILFLFFCFFSLPFVSRAATLSLSPSTGTFSIGSTFDVSILLNTEGQSINALSASISFPPDMLQVVSPSTGKSVIGVWTANPKLDNRLGKIEIEGGIPGGVNASNALVSTITFRVKSVGDAVVRFKDDSKVLLNNGLGTNALTQTSNAVYKFKLPPPAGPIVVSDTHPDQSLWYSSSTVSLKFLNDSGSVAGYSYVVSEDPITNPDDISEGIKNSVAYANVADGVHYFHIKALREGVWGGVTHFAVKVDSLSPADFKIDIAPYSRTSTRQPIIQFTTTDALSGVDHYDLKLVPLSGGAGLTEDDGRLFIESISPYTPSPLSLGSYDVIVRAYDKSGNYREVVERMNITTPVFSFITSTGLEIGGINIKWSVVWFVLIILILLLAYIAYKVYKWRTKVHTAHTDKVLPDRISQELVELQKYRQKYGKAVFVFLMLFSISLFNTTYAQNAHLAPPLITTISKNVSNEEIFYVGGKTDFADEKVIIYVQNLSTGETFSYNAKSDKQGDWFYRHSNFLSPGQYLLWSQGSIGEEMSPPSPQEKMTVSRTAVSFGGGKLSYETIYLFIIILLFAGLIALIVFIGIHLYQGRKKHILLQKEIKEAEESIKRGFAILRKDIESELMTIRKAKLSDELLGEEKEKEIQLMRDLQDVEQRIGKEIWEISQEA